MAKSQKKIDRRKFNGRPSTNWDWDKIDKLLNAQCDGQGIAAMFGVHSDTFYRAVAKKFNMTFSEYAAIKKSEGRELLRAKQFQTAFKGDKTMQIWLGKQYLGQAEQVHRTGEGDVEKIQIQLNTSAQSLSVPDKTDEVPESSNESLIAQEDSTPTTLEITNDITDATSEASE